METDSTTNLKRLQQSVGEPKSSPVKERLLHLNFNTPTTLLAVNGAHHFRQLWLE